MDEDYEIDESSSDGYETDDSWKQHEYKRSWEQLIQAVGIMIHESCLGEQTKNDRTQNSLL